VRGGGAGSTYGAAARSAVIATRNAAASGQRFSGFFASARMIACTSGGGTSGRSVSSCRGASDRCFTSIAGVFDARNGVSPASIW
jgi:hypothetical protein